MHLQLMKCCNITDNWIESSTEEVCRWEKELEPDPRSQIPDPRSQIPDPRSQIPDPRSQIPDPRSQIPDPRSQIPDPRSQIPDPRSQISDLRSQIPDPRSQIPGLGLGPHFRLGTHFRLPPLCSLFAIFYPLCSALFLVLQATQKLWQHQWSSPTDLSQGIEWFLFPTC